MTAKNECHLNSIWMMIAYLESPACVSASLCKMFSKRRRPSFDFSTMAVMTLTKFLFSLAHVLLATFRAGYLKESGRIYGRDILLGLQLSN